MSEEEEKDDLQPEYDLSKLKPADEQKEKRLKRLGMKTISMHSYQPGQAEQDAFAEKARREIEEELRRKQQGK